MCRIGKKQPPRRRGVALIWLVIILVVLLGFLGLACDTAWMALVHHQLQNAADASALAGARWVNVDVAEARARAVQIAAANTAGTGTAPGGGPAALILNPNEANLADGDVVIGKFDRIEKTFTPTLTDPNAVKVTARRTNASANGSQRLFFGGFFGTATSEASRTSIAMIGGGLGAAMLVLDPTGSYALYAGGGGFTAIAGGIIQVNSNSDTAVYVGNNAGLVTPDGVEIVGCASPATLANINGPYHCNAPVLPDPLAWLPDPPQPLATFPNPPINGSADFFSPGYYPNGIRRLGGNAYFASGIYVIDSDNSNPDVASLRITGGNLFADSPGGTLFFIKRGGVTITGNAVLKITPMSSGDYNHVSIFQSRTNYSNADIVGGTETSIEGTMYFPGNLEQTNGPTVHIRGTGPAFSVQIIAWRIRQTGGVPVNVLYDGFLSGPANKVFLVH